MSNPRVAFRHNSKGEIIEVRVFNGDSELDKSSKECASAVEKLRNYGSSIRQAS